MFELASIAVYLLLLLLESICAFFLITLLNRNKTFSLKSQVLVSSVFRGHQSLLADLEKVLWKRRFNWSEGHVLQVCKHWMSSCSLWIALNPPPSPPNADLSSSFLLIARISQLACELCYSEEFHSQHTVNQWCREDQAYWPHVFIGYGCAPVVFYFLSVIIFSFNIFKPKRNNIMNNSRSTPVKKENMDPVVKRDVGKGITLMHFFWNTK